MLIIVLLFINSNISLFRKWSLKYLRHHIFNLFSSSPERSMCVCIYHSNTKDNYDNCTMCVDMCVVCVYREGGRNKQEKKKKTWGIWVLQLCSFTRLFWLFQVLCISIWIGRAYQFLPKVMQLGFYKDCVEPLDKFGEHFHFNSMKYFNPRT